MTRAQIHAANKLRSLRPEVADPEEIERAPKPHDSDDPECAQDLASELDGFLFPGHHGSGDGWIGPED
jgi:hypothetical protein